MCLIRDTFLHIKSSVTNLFCFISSTSDEDLDMPFPEDRRDAGSSIKTGKWTLQF